LLSVAYSKHGYQEMLGETSVRLLEAAQAADLAAKNMKMHGAMRVRLTSSKQLGRHSASAAR
jgi:hypothetical protein